jgi:hypothetical protein
MRGPAAAEYLGISTRTWYRWTATGVFDHAQWRDPITTTVWYKRALLDEWLATHREAS